MKNKVLLITAMLVAGQLFAQKQMTIDECVKYAIANSTQSKNAEIDEQIAKAKVKEITGIGLPQISAEGGFKNFIERPTSILPGIFFGSPDPIPVQFGTKFNVDAGVTATQLIFDGSYLVGLQAARTYKLFSEKQNIKTKTELAAQVRETYYQVQVANKRLEILNESIEQIKATHSELIKMNEAGFIEKIEVDRLKVTLNNMLNKQNQYSKMNNLGLLSLKFMMGMPLQNSIEITEVEEEVQVANEQDSGFSNHPDYKIMEVQQQLAVLDLKNNKVKYAPSLVGFFNYSYSGQRDNFNFFESGQPWFRTGVLGLTLQVPVFDGLQKHNKIQQAKLNLEKVDNGISTLKNAIALETVNAKAQLENSLDELKNQKENQELAKEVYRVTKEKYKAGTSSSLELITAEQEKIKANDAYYNSLLNAMIAKVKLQKATGKLQY